MKFPELHEGLPVEISSLLVYAGVLFTMAQCFFKAMTISSELVRTCLLNTRYPGEFALHRVTFRLPCGMYVCTCTNFNVANNALTVQTDKVSKRS